jgi:starvation-inducible DNA-binding protein
MPKFKSPSDLPVAARDTIVVALNEVLTDGLDLHGQLKVAHWNIKGPHFAALHPLFDQYATEIATHNDMIAERAVTLGGLAVGGSAYVAKHTRLKAYPTDLTNDLRHVSLLADRFATFVKGAKKARGVAEKGGDVDTVDLLTGVVTAWEKNGWFLRATLE